jgi:signal transduction histidine kinase
MFAFKSTRQRFYLIVGLLLLLFCIAYIQLAGFLNKLSTSAQRVQAATLIDKEIRWLGEQFWTLRFWEKVVQTQSHPEADQQFGVTIERIKKRIIAFDLDPFTEQLSENTVKISSLLSQYEESFNHLIQFGIEQRLNRTQLESNYQVLTSTILLSQDTELLKPLLNLDRFLDRYLATHKDSEYKALRMVFTFLQTKLSTTEIMDDRLQSYITKFDTLIEHDFTLEKESRVINAEFDEISRELMTLFLKISQTMEALSQEAVSTSEQLQNNIQRQLLISAGIAFIALLFIIGIIARKIINPIRHMSSVVMQVKAGNDQVRFVSQEKDELAELGFAFNDMLDTIHQHRYRLEALVEERTEKLIETNEQLQQEIIKHKQTEIELQQAKEAAEAANRTKSSFLANMSHEFRTPLNVILGFAQIISRSHDLPLEHRENLDTIIRSGQHLLILVNRLIDISKVDAGHSGSNEQRVDFDRLFEEVNTHEHQQTVYQVAGQQAEDMLFQGTGQTILTSASLATLPHELRAGLQEAVEAIDFDMVLSLIEQIRQQNEPMARALAELVTQYRFDILQALFEEGTS